MSNPKALLEAALFVSEKPLSTKKLSEITNLNEENVKQFLAEIKNDLQKKDRAVDLIETPEGFEFRLKPEYREKVVSLAPFSDLSEGMLRTLSIIAVKQPIKQSVIVRYQGNKVYGYVVNLEKKGLIKTEKAGRTKLITTTLDFEKYFGKSSEEIKEILTKEEKK